MKDLNYTREDVAIHEAGHAVIAYLTGYHAVDGPIDIYGLQSNGLYAAVPLREDDALMEIRLKEGWSLDGAQRIKQRCYIAAAGYTAEQVYAERRCVNFDSTRAFQGAHGDVLTIRGLLGTGHFDEICRALLPTMRDEAVWNCVEGLATALSACQEPMPELNAMDLLRELQANSSAPFGLFPFER